MTSVEFHPESNRKEDKDDIVGPTLIVITERGKNVDTMFVCEKTSWELNILSWFEACTALVDTNGYSVFFKLESSPHRRILTFHS
jgi:hypothetical protein